MKNIALHIYTVAFFSVLSFILFFSEFTAESGGIFGVIQYGYFAFFALSAMLIFSASYWENYSFESAIWIVAAMLIYIFMHTLASYHNFPAKELGTAFVKSMFTYTSLLVGYFLFREKEGKYMIFLVITVIIFFTGIAFNFSIFTAGIRMPNAIYLCIPTFPILLMLRKKHIVALFYLITLFFLIFSGKRAGLIAMFGSFFVYYVTEYYFIRKKDIVLSTLLFAAAAGVLFFLIIQFNNSADQIIQERYYQALETGGSGRLDLYKFAVEDFANASVFRKIFGGGYYFFAFETFYGNPHNDILDILLSYGMLGLGIYLLLYKQLIGTAVDLIRRSHWLAPSFAVALFMFIIFSIFSIVSRQIGSYSLLYIYFGFAYGRLHAEKENPRLLLDKYREQNIPFSPHLLPK